MDSPIKDLGDLPNEFCPDCHELMIPPLVICQNGHRICNRCRPHLETCRLCGGSLYGRRRFSSESKGRLSTSENSGERSRKISSVSEPSSPPIDCSCPLSTMAGLLCSWVGKIEDVKRHVLQNHDKKISDKSGKFSMPFTNVGPDTSYSLLISTLGEVFMRKAHIKDDNFYLVVLYVGPQRNASKYKYSVTVNKRNGVENITICQKTQSFLENCDDIYRKGHCIKLHYDVVAEFVGDNGELPNVMEISKV